jgi:TolB-like protein/DNA-binding winged helix-turn-helix (wHTH) protein
MQEGLTGLIKMYCVLDWRNLRRTSVEEAAHSPRLVRFGTFEADLLAGELRKAGVKLKLTGQPFQVLAILLERPGDVVTREELQKRLWPDTFVDVDHNLNTAINKIREVLGDSAESPRFVETLPRRGYRFIGLADSRKVQGAVPAPGPTALRRIVKAIRLPAFGVLALVAVAALILGLNVRGWRDRLFARTPRSQIQALAVLPFANLSGEADQQYFSDGITEGLITELSRIGSPRVMSRQSVMQYKGSRKPLREIAQELNVDAVLEGAVERSGDRVRVTVQLEQVSPEGQLWANKYDRNIRDVLRLQDEISRAITDEIQVKLNPDERAHLGSTGPVDPEALDDFLRAEFLIHNNDDQRPGIAYFRKAIEKDPAYARAYAGLAWALLRQGNPSGGQRPVEVLQEAREAAERALKLDPSLVAAHISQANVLVAQWNWLEAEKELRIALDLGPNDWEAHSANGFYLLFMGRFDQARAQMKYAAELDPTNPGNSGLGLVALNSRQYDLAIEEFRSVGNDMGLGWAYGQKKMYAEAIASFQRAARDGGQQPVVIAQLVWAYGLAGRKDEALKWLNKLKEIARHRYVAPSQFVNAYLGLGDKEQALNWLERGLEERDQWYAFLKVSPGLDSLRSEPRFQAVLRRMNFPP